MCGCNPKCFMYGVLMLDDIIMNILSEAVEREMNSEINKYSSKIKDDGIYLYQGPLHYYTWKRTVTDTNNTLRSHHFVGGIRKYLGGLLSIMVDEVYLENIAKQCINDIILFNNEQIIQ